MNKYKDVFEKNIVFRQLHSKSGSNSYKKKPIVPEHGVCMEVIERMVIWADGKVSCCVRFDKDRKRIIGDINKDYWNEIINSKVRNKIISDHIKTGKSEYCSDCDYRGIVTI